MEKERKKERRNSMHPTRTLILLSLLEKSKSAPQIAWYIGRLLNPRKPKEDRPPDSLIYKHLNTLREQGIVTQTVDESGGKPRKLYSLNYGCFDGTVVIKSKENILLILSCPYVLTCHRNEDERKKRKMAKCCKYYKCMYSKEPIVTSDFQQSL